MSFEGVGIFFFSFYFIVCESEERFGKEKMIGPRGGGYRGEESKRREEEGTKRKLETVNEEGEKVMKN